jgi:hypothetical protein
MFAICIVRCLTSPVSLFIHCSTDMTMLGKMSRADLVEQGLIPQAYEPTNTDVRFIGIMGYVGIGACGIRPNDFECLR